MKLDMDLLRDVLLTLENYVYLLETPTHHFEYEPISLRDICDKLPNHTAVDILYTLQNLDDAGYISADELYADNSIFDFNVNYITFKGHEFISSVRDTQKWHGIKKVLPAIRSYSLEAINMVANGMTTAALTTYFQTNLPADVS